MAVSKPLQRILCYGDSLTAGFCFRGSKFVPYADTLESSLSRKKLNIEVDHFGFSGWTTQRLLINIDEDVLRDFTGKSGPGLNKAFQKQDYHLLILMAGTNDLGHATIEEIFKNLQDLMNCAIKANVKVLSVGIPDSGYIYHNPNVRAKRDQINEKLAKYANETALVTYTDPPIKYEPKCASFDDDGLHFSEFGYQSFGDGLVEVVQSILINS